MITNYNRQLVESKFKKLESEIEEWKRTYKNTEKHNPTAENSLAKVFSSLCPPCWILVNYAPTLLTAYQISVHNACRWLYEIVRHAFIFHVLHGMHIYATRSLKGNISKTNLLVVFEMLPFRLRFA